MNTRRERGRSGDGSRDGDECSSGDGNEDGSGDGDWSGDVTGKGKRTRMEREEGGGELRYPPHQEINKIEDQALPFRKRHHLCRQ